MSVDEVQIGYREKDNDIIQMEVEERGFFKNVFFSKLNYKGERGLLFEFRGIIFLVKNRMFRQVLRQGRVEFFLENER